MTTAQDFMRNLIKQAHPNDDLNESKLEEYCQGVVRRFLLTILNAFLFRLTFALSSLAERMIESFRTSNVNCKKILSTKAKAERFPAIVG